MWRISPNPSQRRLLSVLPSDVKQIVSPHKSSSSGSSNGSPIPNQDSVDSVVSLLSPDEDPFVNGNSNSLAKKKKKSTKGWDGEIAVVSVDDSGVEDEHEGAILILTG